MAGDLAIMFGNLNGRVAACFKAPPGLTRKGKPVTKICFPKVAQKGKRLVKIGPRTTINVAHLEKIGVNPPQLVAYQKTGGGTGTQAQFFPVTRATRGEIPSHPGPTRRKKGGGKKKKTKR